MSDDARGERRAVLRGRAIAAACMLLGLAIVPWGCFAWIDRDRRLRIEAIASRLETLDGATSADREPVRAGLAVARQRAETADLPLTAVFALEGRFAAVAADGVLTDFEIAHLKEMLDDIPDWTDPDHPIKYMGNR